jgi:serine/threonine protein kinase
MHLPRPFGGKYELLERLGAGAGGEVFRARELSGDFPREVCIKRLGGLLRAQEARAMREEARLLTCIRHANVVTLMAMGEEDGAPFLVLELIRGPDLATLVRELVAQNQTTRAGLLPDPVAVHVACAIVRAIGAVQRAVPGLVHRDVTPHNVLISSEGEVKLTDFGIALSMGRVRTTSPSFVRGKLGYMAPEQVRNEPLDVRADLFAAGVILFELLARARPFGACRGVDELQAIASGAVTPLATFRPRLPRPLLDAVDRLLRPSPNERFPCADDALRAMAPFSAGDFGSLRLAALARMARPVASVFPGESAIAADDETTRRTALARAKSPRTKAQERGDDRSRWSDIECPGVQPSARERCTTRESNN